VSHVTVSGGWGTREKYHMLRLLGFGGRREKVSHVTVSGDWREEGKAVTCYGFWGLEGQRKSCHMLRFLGIGTTGEKLSHVTVSGVWREKGKVSHVTVSGDWRAKGKDVTCYGYCGLNGCSYTFCLRANTFIQGP
jgi:hypothetical protein